MPKSVKSYVKPQGELTVVDISCRGRLSPTAFALWERYDNKSRLVHEALEQYAIFGKQVLEDLGEIKHTLRSISGLPSEIERENETIVLDPETDNTNKEE